jgi:hypothetical protein
MKLTLFGKDYEFTPPPVKVIDEVKELEFKHGDIYYHDAWDAYIHIIKNDDGSWSGGGSGGVSTRKWNLGSVYNHRYNLSYEELRDYLKNSHWAKKI